MIIKSVYMHILLRNLTYCIVVLLYNISDINVLYGIRWYITCIIKVSICTFIVCNVLYGI